MPPTPHQSALVKAWNKLAMLIPGQTMSPELSLGSVMQSAAKSVGKNDFGGASFQRPLEQLLDALNDTGDLHHFGRFYVKSIVKELLMNRLKLVDLWKRQPEILDEKLEQPIIILGLPRTGTSFLFNLLSQDPTHRVLTNWEATVSQVAPSGSYSFERDPRRTKGKFLMRFQNYLVPQMKEMHEFHLDGPEECTPILMQEFLTQAFDGIFNVPSYSQILDSASRSATYAHHKKTLKTLQWKYPGKRWLLKSPDHIASISDILETYPDACVVHMHRDPVKSIASWASLNSAFRGIYMRSVDPKELGAQVMSRLATDLDRYLEQRPQCDPTRFLDLHYNDLTNDPLGAVTGIYRHFELEFSTDAEAHIQAYLIKDKIKKRGHIYSPEDFGLTPLLIQRRFHRYISEFDIPRGKSTLN